MKTLEDFKTFFDTQLVTDFEALEGERLKIARSQELWEKLGFYLLVGLIGIPFGLLFFQCFASLVAAALSYFVAQFAASAGAWEYFQAVSFWFIYFALNLCALGFGISWLIGHIKSTGKTDNPRNIPLRKGSAMSVKQYHQAFNETVITQIAAFLMEDSYYQRDGFVSKEEFSDCRFFSKQIDYFTGEDYFYGRCGQTKIQFSELNVQHRAEYRDSKGRRCYEWIKLFDGVYMVADFHKEFKGRTILVPESTYFFRPSEVNLAPVKLEDPNFEKVFRAYGSDQIETRYILSTSMMRRLTELFEANQERFPALSFFDSKVHIAFSDKRNLFEGKVRQSLVDFETIKPHFIEMNRIVNLVELLDLNTRIWSKD